MSVQTERGIPLCTLNPKFLHTNSTSHTWSFSAIAELIDNAYDPDVKAKTFWIDKTRIGGQDCLTFIDNGAGMDFHKMYRMLSLGFSDKKTVRGHAPVGMYGNGFKSGSMHLGKDAIVFSKKGESMCVGMLSQTYLHDTQMEKVVVPIVTFKCIGESIHPESEHKESLQAILRYSLFQTEEELHSEFKAITQDSSGSTGTRIIIWNLCKESEFDFETDHYDIQIPDVYEGENDKYKQSLRAYCSVLYLKPRMQIIIRGQIVTTELIAKSLAHPVTEKYIPSFLKEKRRSIPITFGFNPKSQEHYGVMMYHKNRLIKAYERVRCQNRANKKGVGVIAVIECNFLTPTHNKQDFNNTEEYRSTMKTLDKKLEEYWNVMYNKIGQNGTVPLENILEDPKQNWVQCDDCRKWRKLPDVTDKDKLPEKWFCRMNSDKRFRSCDEPEEPEDSEDETYQQEKKNLKVQQKLKKQQMEEEKRNAEIKDLTRAEEKLFRELRQTLNPKFLHTNSTSHTWPFSAIAELIDNAYDPDVSARQFWIDKTRIRDQDCLTFMDNGAGMDYNKMYKMLSFGFSDKETINGHVPIGLYGNGFKSGSMRLGKDAIVFSKKKDSMCVGMLSQTYLQKIQAENIVVPIVTFKRTGESIRPEPQHIESLQAILQYSLFQKEEELLAELEAINTHLSRDSTGTRIIIWNLRKTSTGKSEFDFEVNRYDIQIPADVFESEKEQYRQPCHVLQSSPESDFSLRAYCSVLYLKPRMQINIRGSKVKTQLIAKSLAHIVKDKYKPTFLNKERISITFGYNTKSKEHYGVMMYHKNRLIKSYERVGCQNKANNRGVGVIAVIECNFLKPTHNKQDFDYTDEYRRTITTLGLKLEEYWKAIRHAKGLNSTVPVEDIPKNPDQNWVQCDDCQKWRKLPDGIDTDKLPEKWFCRMNPVTEYRGCDKPEEAEDSEDESSTCLKEYKQHEKSLKKQQEQKKMQEQQRNAELAQQNEDLKRTQENLLRKLQQTGPSSPSTPTTSRAASTARSSVDSTPIMRSTSSPLDNMPIITEVTSLSRFTRRKRSLGERSEGKALKKSRLLNDYCNNAPESPSTSAFISDLLTSQMEIPDNNGSTDKEEEESNTDDDDDIVIDETKSTPRPKTFNLAKVKLERSTSNDVQYSDDVSMDTPTTEGSRNATTNPSTSNVSMTTQTECNMIVKTEDDQQRKIEKDEIKEKDSDATGIECRKDKGTEINRSISEDSRCRSVDIDRPSFAEGSDRSTGGRSPMPEEPAMDFGLNVYNMPTLEAQKQQDSLLELMEATAKEREEYKMQAQSLALQLKDKECELLKLTVKKEFSHKNIQTDPLEEKDYKTLYLEATQRNEQLTKTINEMKKKQEEMLLQMKAEKEAQDRMKAEDAGHSATPNVDDEMALQVDFLLRELDQRNAECHELKIKVESLEQVKARCEQLQRDLDQLRKEKVECTNGPEKNRTDKASSTQTAQHNTVDASANRANQIIENKETNENTAGGENTVTNAKLRQLRSSVARLLVTFVPALDPEQVNYDCEVIDEILNQVIQEISPTLTTST
nr:MORC family CW-type zinc finger protein 3a [Misgurnus anguillicaudatus]